MGWDLSWLLKKSTFLSKFPVSTLLSILWEEYIWIGNYITIVVQFILKKEVMEGWFFWAKQVLLVNVLSRAGRRGSTAVALGISVLSMNWLSKETAFEASDTVGVITGSSTSIWEALTSIWFCASNHCSAFSETCSVFLSCGFKSSAIHILSAEATIPAFSNAWRLALRWTFGRSACRVTSSSSYLHYNSNIPSQIKEG